MSELINKLILKKLAGRCEFFQFDYANYFANCFLSKFITPKHLKLAAGGMPRGAFFKFPLEGYRTPIPNKTYQTTKNKTPKREGGARKASLL